MAETTDTDSASAARDTPQADRTLTIERVFKAPPERVFAAWTDPATLTRWWGPEGHHAPEYTMDVREGGAWRTVMQNDKGDRHVVSGVYREISPPRRLVTTWAWEQPDGTRGHETTVEVMLEPSGSGTRLTLVQRVFLTPEDRNNHRMGWDSSFNCLDDIFA